MTERLRELVLDESKWLTGAMLASLLAVASWIRGRARTGALDRLAILGAMNRFYGCTIGVMGSGHLLAVAVAELRGTLRGSPWILYPLGLALAVPAWLLCFGVPRLAAGEEGSSRRSAALNAWLGTALLAFGLHNLPLAAPAALNLAYQFHRRRAVGVTILAVALLANLALFVGSLVFLASGRSFEEFSGM
jgi:hypothetical protein